MLAGAGIAGDEAAATGRHRLERDRRRSLARGDAGGAAPPRRPSRIDPGRLLQGTLRPYQQAGVQWLYLLTRLRLGACLADDMGLGKTIQVLSLLLVLKSEARAGASRRLLVAPASLLANWAAEIARFAPSLKAVVVHPSAAPAEKLEDGRCGRSGRVSTSSSRATAISRARRGSAATPWRLVVLDEAQAIKNPGAKQTRTVKQLRADARIALTGTPIENRLGDLWSIFDFINPGLLGSSKQFSTFVKQPRRPAAQSVTARCASWCAPTSCAA